jgi:hypothetical protein
MRNRFWIGGIIGGAIALMSLPARAAERLPRDIRGHWAETCLRQVVRQGWIKPYPDGTFRPNHPMRRGEFAETLMATFPDAPLMRVHNGDEFVDIPEGYWLLFAIRESYETNFLSGYPNRFFAPLEPVTRLHVVLAIASGLNYAFPSQPAETILARYFLDAGAIAPYAHDAVAAATENGLVVSFPNAAVLNPDGLASRGDVAAMLCQVTGSQDIIPPQYQTRPQNPATPTFTPLF